MCAYLEYFELGKNFYFSGAVFSLTGVLSANYKSDIIHLMFFSVVAFVLNYHFISGFTCDIYYYVLEEFLHIDRYITLGD